MSNFKTVEVDDLDQLRDETGCRLIDVRTEDEIRQTGLIPGAEHISLKTLPQVVDQIDPELITVFYCQTGNRSSQAAAYFSKRGYPNVHTLTGGISAWLRTGRPVEKRP